MLNDEDEVDSRPNKEISDFLRTADDWSNVAEIVPGFKDSSDDCNNEEPRIDPTFTTPSITVESLIQYLNSGVLDEYLSQVTERPKTTWEIIYSCMCAKPSLPPNIENAKQSILATALIPYNNDVQIYLSVLRTLYRQLTGSKFDCPRYGHHWEDIGFQGNDPAADLRGVGILGLVNALYLVVTPEIFNFSKQVYTLSLKESQEFPLMVLSLNVTRICLHILRDGLLDRRCFRDGDTWLSFNNLYVSIMYHIYHIWKTQHKTISNSGFVLQDAEEIARKNPEKMLEDFSQYLSGDLRSDMSRTDIETETEPRGRIHKLTDLSSAS